MLPSYYDSLATKRDVNTLLSLAPWDERVYHAVVKHQLVGDVAALLPDPRAARFLARGAVGYEAINQCSFEHFVTLASLLARYEGAIQGAALADAIGSIAIPERHRLDLFNFSESFRHLILSRNLFAQRATVRCLSYMFCDDFLADAVAVLQHKTDVLNHVNRIFVDSPDFWSWRFSVRAMSLAGGYNEDRLEVDKTERFCYTVTKVVPEFLVFFTLGAVYGRFRHFPNRIRGQVPLWLARHRAWFTGAWCGTCGVLSQSLLEWRCFRARENFELRREQEMRRRRGAARRGLPYKANPHYDDTAGITTSIWWLQAQHYLLTAALLTVSVIPLRKIEYPKFLGDVPWKYPFVPRFFPVTLNMPCASRCAVPFAVVPFAAGIMVNSAMSGASVYDFYVHARYKWWQRYRAAE